MNISNLIESGSNVSITTTPQELKEFALFIIEKVKGEEDKKQHDNDTLLTRDEAMKFLGITSTTLWKWGKTGILKPTNLGGKVRYKKSALMELVNK